MASRDRKTAPRSLFSSIEKETMAKVRYASFGYERLDRMRSERYERARALLDSWYCNLPEHARNSIATDSSTRIARTTSAHSSSSTCTSCSHAADTGVLR